jgi:hypothetical protein
LHSLPQKESDSTADRLANIASAVGGNVIGKAVRFVWPGKNPRHTGGISIAHAPNQYGYVVKSFYPDVPSRDAFDFVRARLLRNGVDLRPDVIVEGDHEDRAGRETRAMSLWRDGVDPRGTFGERYLNERRKLILPVGIEQTLRWNADAHALIALFRDIETDEPTGVGRIYLTPDGALRNRLFLGRVSGAAVKLSPPQDGLLCVAEGVETAMAAMQLGVGPTWAAGSSDAVAAFPIIDGVHTLIICAEKDNASRAAVEQCARRWRWHAAGHDVAIASPNGKGDLNDTLICGGKFTVKPYARAK